MIIYNITFNITPDIEQEWVQFIRHTQIPQILATGVPLECKLLKLLTEIENEGATYTTQFGFRTMEDFLAYQTSYQQQFLDSHHLRFHGKYVYFRTLLQEM